MIEINLLPHELKLKTKKTGIEPVLYVYLILAIFTVVICVHVFLFLFGLVKTSHLYVLKNKWKTLESQRKVMEDFKKEYELISADAKILQQLLNRRTKWAEKLNRLSSDLPSWVWLNELTFDEKGFVLKGSVVSLEKEEFNLIDRFISNLKNDNAFIADFSSLELSSVEKRMIAGYEVVDFNLAGTPRSK